MLDTLFARAFDFARTHKRRVLLSVAAATAAALFGLSFVRYEGNIDLMLPPDKDVTRSLHFLRDSNLSDKIIISLALTSPDKGKKELFAAVDQLSASLTPPFFTKVTSGVSMADAMEEFSVLQYAPQILSEAEITEIGRWITPPRVSQKLKQIYLQSFRPESIFTSTLSRTDPLGIKMLLLGKLRALPASMGYDVAVEDGHFISRDGRHALLIVQTSVPMTDSKRSKELVQALDQELKQLPGFITADVIGGHLHTVSNEKVITRDIKVASAVASIAFMVLFLAVFRDPRAFFVYIIPLIAVVWSIIISTFFEGKLSYLVIGFGTAIAGISIDYGLLVYIAMKRGADASQMVKLAKLVSIDAITTIFSFFVLYFSVIQGYHQLSLFSMLCVLICLVISLAVLPLVLSWDRYTMATDSTIGDRMKRVRWPAKSIVVGWTLITLACLALSFSIRFDSDVKKLDGSDPAVFQAEEHFYDAWGGRNNRAILVAQAKTYEEAMQLNDLLYREASATVGPENFTSLAPFWPSERTRAENAERWDRFWKSGQEAKLRGLIRKASTRYQFTDRAFAPFFDGLYSHTIQKIDSNGILARLEERFVVKRPEGYSLLSYFPDEQRFIDAVAPVISAHPGVFLVSGKMMVASISRSTERELRILAPLAVLFNVVLSWMFFRNWKETFISLVPVITGVVWLFGIMSLFKMPLNVVNVVAAIVTTGVIVDYGLGMTYEYRYNLRIGTVIAVTLSAVTNVIGAGVLLFAKHPALYSTGVAMVICMVAGYLSSVIVVPSLCSLMSTSRQDTPAP
jgi:predicted RND superfamily exporter protein